MRALYSPYFLNACLDCRFRPEVHYCKAIAAHVGTRTIEHAIEQVKEHVQSHDRNSQGFSGAVACISLRSLQLTPGLLLAGFLLKSILLTRFDENQLGSEEKGEVEGSP